MKTFILTLVTFILTTPTFADKARGGGDPDTIEFLGLGEQFCAFLASTTDLANQKPKCDALILSLRYNLESDGGPTYLQFRSQLLHDDQGVEKVALYDRLAGTITVSRPLWEALTLDKRLFTASMELSGLLDLEGRYSLSERLREHIAELLPAPSSPAEKSFSLRELTYTRNSFTVSFQTYVTENSKTRKVDKLFSRENAADARVLSCVDRQILEVNSFIDTQAERLKARSLQNIELLLAYTETIGIPHIYPSFAGIYETDKDGRQFVVQFAYQKGYNDVDWQPQYQPLECNVIPLADLIKRLNASAP